MTYRWILWLIVFPSWGSTAVAAGGVAAFEMDSHFLMPPDGMLTIGDSHGDIAVSPTGEIYVSVQGGLRPGVQVYSGQGHYLRNVPNAPNDLHGFVIAAAPDGMPSIFGARLVGQQIVELALDGKVLLTISGSAIPDQYKARTDDRVSVNLTSVAVAPNGDIYAVDGYGLDFIHRFDRTGRYLNTFGGRGEPWDFKQCHKIALDSRFKPPRLLCADRQHDRLIHMDLEGHVLGVFAAGLRRPSALAVYRDELAVAELGGRVTVFDLQGKVIASIGENDNAQEVRTSQISPDRWDRGLFYSPHGITYDRSGNLLVTEWNQWGRVVLLSRKRGH